MKALLLTLLFIPCWLPAQLAAEAGFSFNKVQDLTAGDSPKGKHFGLIYTLNIKRAGLRTGLRYMNGDLFLNLSRDQVLEDGVTLENKFLEVPLELKYRRQRSKNFQPYLTAGVVGRFPIEEGGESSQAISKVNMAGTAAIGIEIKGKEFGIMPEIGYAFPISKITNGTYTVNGVTFEAEEQSAFNGLILRVSIGWIR